MTTIDQKRMLKLAGLLKEGVEEWIDEEETPSGADAVRARIKKMNTKAKEGGGPDDFYLLLDPDYMINAGIDTEEKLDQYFAHEDEREAYKASLHRGFDDDDDFSDYVRDVDRDMPTSWDEEAEEADKEWLSQSLHTHAGQDDEDLLVKEPVASAEEEELERLPMHSGMGRRLEETYIDNLGDGSVKESLEEAPPPSDPEGRKKAGMKPLKDQEEKGPFGEALPTGSQLPKDALKVNPGLIENLIRALVREVLLEKKAKTYKGKSMRLGGGGRFAKFVDSLKKSGKSEEQARAIAYKAGAKKYGKEKMKKMAAAGKKRAAKKD